MASVSDPPDLEAIADVLRTLGHETRLRLMNVLLVHGEQSVGDLKALTGTGQPALSQQLAILRKAGLVHTRRVAKLVYYSVAPDAVAATAAFLAGLAGVRPGEQSATPGEAHPPFARGSAAMFARIL